MEKDWNYAILQAFSELQDHSGGKTVWRPPGERREREEAQRRCLEKTESAGRDGAVGAGGVGKRRQGAFHFIIIPLTQ